MHTLAPPSIDTRTFRAVMGRFATGVTIVSHAGADGVRGMTANSFLSVSLDPQLVLVSLAETTRMADLLTIDQPFGISILAENQTALSNHFAGRPNANATAMWHWEHDVPLLMGAVAQIAARVVATHQAGDHMLVIGQVAHLAQGAGRPLVFHGGQYAQLAGA